MVKIYFWIVYSLELSHFFLLLLAIATQKKKSGGNLNHNKQKCFKFLKGKLHSILKEIGSDIKENLLSDDHP